MARPPKSIQVITANRLIDGRVVFFTSDRAWETDIDASEVFADPQAAETVMPSAQASVAAREVVDPYPIAVTIAGGRVTPDLLRERIRATGPTIPTDFNVA